ncbi:MAG: ligand-binding sensor domain-containing protein [bacterium]
MNKKIIIFLYALLQFASAKAEFITNVHAISRRDGLSDGAVNSIVKDAEGYVWMATWNGLNRYDGSNIVSYLPGNSSNSIHNHVIREMYPLASGSIWMLTNKGVGLYDNVGDRFLSFFTNESDQINYENDIAICHSDRISPTKVENIWLGTLLGGEVSDYHIDIASELITIHAPHVLPGMYVLKLVLSDGTAISKKIIFK